MYQIIFLSLALPLLFAAPMQNSLKLINELDRLPNKEMRIKRFDKFKNENKDNDSELLIYLNLIDTQKLDNCEKIEDSIEFAGKSPSTEDAVLNKDAKVAIDVLKRLCN